MNKILRIFFYVLCVALIFVLVLKSEQLARFYSLPVFAVPSIIVICFIYISYKYLKNYQLQQEIITIINHTFRTPLTGITWHAKELEGNIPQKEKLLYLQNIENLADKLINIIDTLVGIKDVNDISGYYFEAISLREIVEKSLKKYRGLIIDKNITFQVSTFKDIPFLTVDLKKISFVIDTIIENAISYTNKDGKILIDCIADTKKLTLYVSDTGIGLNFIDKLMIFSKFYRNKRAKKMNTDGMGLRLYLSRQILKRHNGKIYAKSNGENKGTTFFMKLPFKK